MESMGFFNVYLEIMKEAAKNKMMPLKEGTYQLGMQDATTGKLYKAEGNLTNSEDMSEFFDQLIGALILIAQVSLENLRFAYIKYA